MHGEPEPIERRPSRLARAVEHVRGRIRQAIDAAALLGALTPLSVVGPIDARRGTVRVGAHDFYDPEIARMAEAAQSIGATGATVTGSLAGGNWNTNGAWAVGAQPTAADDVLLTALSGSVTIPSGVTAVCRSLDCTGYTATFTFAATISTLTIGDSGGGACTFVSTMTLTLTGIGTINFVSTQASTSFSLTTGGKTMPNLTVNVGTTTTIQFAAAVTATGATITHTAGGLNTNDQTVSCATFSSSNANTRTLTLGNSGITCTLAGTAWTTATSTNLTLSPGSSMITLNGAGATFASGTSLTWGALSLTGSGTASVTGTTLVTFGSISRYGTAVKTDILSVGVNVTVSGTFTADGNSILNRVLVQSSTIGTARTITAAGVVASNVDFMDITGAGAGSWNLAAVGGKSGDAGGNSGITFTASATQTATGTASFTWSTHGWTSRVPLPQDDVVISNAFVASQTITADMPRLGRSVTLTGATGTPTFSVTVSPSIFGNLTLIAGMTLSTGGLNLTLGGRGAQTITMATQAWAGSVILAAPGGTYTQQDNFATATSAANTLRLDAGTWTANGFDVTTTIVSAVFTAIAKTLNMGTGTWHLQGTQATPWSLNQASATVNASTSTIAIETATATNRTFAGGGKTYNVLTYTVAGSTGSLTITGANTFSTINFSDTSNARTLTLPASTTTTVTNVGGIAGTAGKLMTVNSSAGGTAATLATTAGGTMKFVALQDITATPSNAVYALDSTNTSGNTGVVFSPPSVLPVRRVVGVSHRPHPAVQRGANW